MNEFRIGQVIEVNLDQTKIVLQSPYWGQLYVTFHLHDGLLVIPQVGEQWLVQRIGNDWLLDRKLETGSENVSISDMNAGDRRLDGPADIHISAGKNVKITGDANFGDGVTFENSPEAPTPDLEDNSTKVATTEYVQGNITALSASADGWVSSPYTWTYVDSTHISAPGDTGNWAGQKFKATISGTTNYFFISDVTVSGSYTKMNLWGGANYRLSQNTITLPYYSNESAPKNWPYADLSLMNKGNLLAGAVNSNGTVLSGTGFSVSKGGTGLYTITFNPTLVRLPDVSISIRSSSILVAPFTSNPTTSGFTIQIQTTGAGATDAAFSFTAQVVT